MGSGPSEDTGDGEAGSPRPAGLTILIVAGIGLVVAIALAAIVSANRDVPVLDAGTPEGVVQAYIDAMVKGDEASAHAYLSDELQEECSVGDLRNNQERSNNIRVTLRSVSAGGDEAEVEVTITEDAGGGLFGGGGYSFEEFFFLTRSGATWVISERPWPIYDCSN